MFGPILRYGSLDRRRATNGWLESRSMEHLESLHPTSSPHIDHHISYHPTPPNNSHSSSNNHITPIISPQHPTYLAMHFNGHKVTHHDSMELATSSGESHPTTANCSFDTTSDSMSSNDVVDGVILRSNLARHRSHSGPGKPPFHNNSPHNQTYITHNNHHNNHHHHHQPLQHQHNGYINRNNNLEKNMSSQHNTVHRLVRTPSGRSYMETTFLGESPRENNQENIPPLRPTNAELLPLKATSKERSDLHSHVPLRPTASINTADLHPPRAVVNELIPLRATKSSSELPPLKATTPKPDHTCVNMSDHEEPLISLAEAVAKSGKKDRGKEWYETSLDSPGLGRKARKGINGHVVDINENNTIMSNSTPSSQSSHNHNISTSNAIPISGNHPSHNLNNSNAIPAGSQSSHNISTSSIGSTSSGSGSVFQSPNEGNDSLNSSMSVESARPHMMISQGSFQPSIEVCKPFEMADFYKYSVKYRKQSSSSSLTNNSHNTSSESPMSPVLPPRAQILMNGNNNNKLCPSPGIIAQQSTPAPQQKGVYQPLTPLTCKPLEVVASIACGEANDPVGSASWESTPLHQAVPATVTTKRAATLV